MFSSYFACLNNNNVNNTWNGECANEKLVSSCPKFFAGGVHCAPADDIVCG